MELQGIKLKDGFYVRYCLRWRYT